MQVKLRGKDFRDLILMVKNFRIADENNIRSKTLKYIQLIFKEGYLHAYACNGYMAIKHSLDINYTGSEQSILIEIPEVLPRLADDVEVEFSGNEVIIKYRNITFRYLQPQFKEGMKTIKDLYCELDNAFNEVAELDKNRVEAKDMHRINNVYINPIYLISAINSIKNVYKSQRERIKISVENNCLRAMRLAINDTIIYIMPMRPPYGELNF